MRKSILQILFYLSFYFTIQGYSQEIINLEKDLVVYYNFDQNILDHSGNENHGQVGGILKYTDGCRGESMTAAEFNGVNNFVSPEKVFDLPDRSVSIWAYAYTIQGITPNNPNILCHDSNDLEFGQYRIQFNEGVFRMVAAGNSGFYDSAEIMPGKWYHFVFTKEGDNIQYYINGQLVQRSKAGKGGSTYDPIPELVLGAGRSKIRQFYKGRIDEFRLYKRAINECEIAALYHGTMSLDTNPRNYFPMNGGEVKDSLVQTSQGALHGGVEPIEDRFGNPEGALHFNGNDAYIEIEPMFDDHNQTISFWIKPDEKINGSTDQVVMKQNHSSLQFGAAEVRLVNGYLQLFTGSDRSKQSYKLPGTSDWHNVTMTKDGLHSRYFLNGELIGESSEDYSVDISRSYSAMVLGADAATMSAYFAGAIDDLRIFDRVISQCELDSLVGEKRKGYEEGESQDFQVLLLPNPNDGRFEIRLIGISYDLLESIKIFDLLGRLIYDDSAAPASREVVFDSAARATYICKVVVAGKTFTIPFVKAD